MRKKREQAARESSLASGWKVEGEDPVAADDVAPLSAEADPEPASEGAVTAPEFGNGALVVLGVFGGLYLLYAWVWLSWARYYSDVYAEQVSASGSLGSALQQIVFWVAPLAPLLWFVAVLLLNRGKGLRGLVLWIVIGAIVLLPLPAILGGGA